MAKDIASGGYRASNGIFYRVVGDGAPLLLLHGLMVSGAMFDPFVELPRKRFRMLIPDLRGHGNSGAPAPDRATARRVLVLLSRQSADPTGPSRPIVALQFLPYSGLG